MGFACCGPFMALSGATNKWRLFPLNLKGVQGDVLWRTWHWKGEGHPPTPPEGVKNSNAPLTRPCERLSSVHPSPPVGARELNLMFTFPSPQRGEGLGVRGRVQSSR